MGPQGRSGWVRKISPPPGLDPRTVQPVAIWTTRLVGDNVEGHSRRPYYARSIDNSSGLMSLKYGLAHKL